MPEKIQKLEAALRLWEDTNLVLYAALLIQSELLADGQVTGGRLGICSNYATLRQYMLQYQGGSFDFEKYIGEDTRTELSVNGFNHFPYALTMWVYKSRRVYHLSADLQALLMNTAIEDLSMSDISWPFDAFAVTLDLPIKDSNGRASDCILISPFGTTPKFEKRLAKMVDQEQISYLQSHMTINDLVHETLFGRQERKRLLRAIENGRVEQERELILRGLDSLSMRVRRKGGPIHHTIFTRDKGFKIGEILKSSEDSFDDSMRLVIGLCMYLRSLPKGSSHLVARRKPVMRKKGSVDRKAVTDGANVCTVTSIYILSAEERSIVSTHSGHSGIELRAHWREGHWRRPPGKGSDPNYPRTVWVRPTLVRRDRLTKGSVPEAVAKVM